MSSVSHSPDLDSTIRHALEALDAVTQPLDGVEALGELQGRLRQGQFRLAVLGQFKRGKSTFLNALLGEHLLPTDILPVTAIPTFIQSSQQLFATVSFIDDRTPVQCPGSTAGDLKNFLHDYATEAGNPDNHKQVRQVDIGHPAPILQQGVVLVDTPGIGSTLRHNTEVAYQILPQCDAALFLVSPDPPITEAELDYLRQIREVLPRTFFLLNKVDFLDKQQITASLIFLSDQLKTLCEGAPQVVSMSARDGLVARQKGDDKGWKKSGMAQVEQNLIDFFAREKQHTFQDSMRRRVDDQLNMLVMQLQLGLEALRLPVDDLVVRIGQFQQILPDIEREKQAAADVLSGDLKRIEAQLTRLVEDVRGQAKQLVNPKFEEIVQSVVDTEEVERQARAMVAAQLPKFFAPALLKVDETIKKQASDILTLHQKRCNGLIEHVKKVAAELFSIPYQAPLVERVYAHFDAPAWSQDLFISDMDPIGQKITRKFFTQRFRRRRTIQRLREQVLKLLNENTEQIHWALRRGLDESFRRYAFQLNEQLDKTIAATRAAMDIALQKKTQKSASVKGQIELLEKTVTTLQELIRSGGDSAKGSS